MVLGVVTASTRRAPLPPPATTPRLDQRLVPPLRGVRAGFGSLPYLAGREGPLQANGSRGRVGRPPAGDDDGRVHHLFRPDGRRAVGGLAVPAVRLRRAVALDVLRDGRRQRGEQRGGVRTAHHQD